MPELNHRQLNLSTVNNVLTLPVSLSLSARFHSVIRYIPDRGTPPDLNLLHSILRV